jgi:lysozyme
METSQKGINLIKMFEGLHDGDLKKIGLQPKKDPIGIWTEGYGHAMKDSKGRFIKSDKMPLHTIKTEAEAVKLLQDDLKKFESIVKNKVKVCINQNQFDALVSHTYNTGGSDTLFKLINNNASKKDIENWFTQRYISASGVILKGLINRRRTESNLYFS